MANVKIQALDNGPLMVKGEVEVLDGQGKLIETKQECYLCRCGNSGTQPYCDGAHEGKFNNEVRA
jgi:CDGSH-type Zn-finger protein